MRTTLSLTTALLLATASAASAGGPRLNDPQIATIALTAHQIDVARGKYALAHTKNDNVRQFAQQMVDDHSVGAAGVLELAKKLHVTPEESAVTQSLKKGAAETLAKLKKLHGAAFDKAYIEAEVGYHQAVIDAVNGVLIPSVQNAEVKQALVDTGPLLIGHLEHAKHVLAMFASR
jgi:putative membrane protein